MCSSVVQFGMEADETPEYLRKALPPLSLKCDPLGESRRSEVETPKKLELLWEAPGIHEVTEENPEDFGQYGSPTIIG